jgi:hypothetical protein
MALQVPHQVALLPQTSSVPTLSVAQAKAALLALGEQAEEERRERGPVLRKYSVWISLAVALAGAAVPIIGALRSRSNDRRRLFARPGAAATGFSLGLLLRLLRPALPFVLRFLAQRRQARAARAAHNGRAEVRRWAHR